MALYSTSAQLSNYINWHMSNIFNLVDELINRENENKC